MRLAGRILLSRCESDAAKGIVMANSLQSKSDADLLAWANNFSTLINAGAAAYGLTSAQATAYGTLYTSFSSAFALVQNPATKTKVTVSD